MALNGFGGGVGWGAGIPPWTRPSRRFGFADSPKRNGDPTLAEAGGPISLAVTASSESYADATLVERLSAAIAASSESHAAASLAERIVAAITASSEDYAAATLVERISAAITASSEDYADAALTVGPTPVSLSVTASSESHAAATLVERLSAAIASASESHAAAILAERIALAVTAATEDYSAATLVERISAAVAASSEAFADATLVNSSPAALDVVVASSSESSAAATAGIRISFAVSASGESHSAAMLSRPTLSGITRDGAGAPLGSVTVKVFRTADDVLLVTGVSHATTGAYSVSVPNTTDDLYAVAYLESAPDLAGTTIHSLRGDFLVDLFLRAGEPVPSDIRLQDPTVADEPDVPELGDFGALGGGSYTITRTTRVLPLHERTVPSVWEAEPSRLTPAERAERREKAIAEALAREFAVVQAPPMVPLAAAQAGISGPLAGITLPDLGALGASSSGLTADQRLLLAAMFAEDDLELLAVALVTA